MRIEVVYSPAPRVVECVVVELGEAATVQSALDASGILQRHAGIDLSRQRVGVWGRVCALGDALKDGDRVELYRALRVDPMEGRRRRLEHQARAGGRPRRR